jgi:hypothetical protein
MEYQLIRSRRKTIAICIARDGSVIVRAPLRTAQTAIDCFVQEKQSWIQEKSAQMAQYDSERKEFQVSAGSRLALLGCEYPVALADQVSFDGAGFYITDEPYETLKPKLIQLYKSLAEQIIPERVGYFSKRTGWAPSGVRIGSANTAWGSCSGKNKLNFTWKLVLAAPEEIDYVIVHELAHLQEHNHSKRFWKLVESVLPDYQARRSKLKLVGKKLQKIGLS